MINEDLVEYSVGCLRLGGWWVPAILCTNVDDATSSGIVHTHGNLKQVQSRFKGYKDQQAKS
jgi:hypothetical protein